MSTQERVSVTSWWLEYVRRVVVQWVRKTTAFAVFNFNIVCRPTQTSKVVISDDDPKGLLRALKYYSKMFALAFAIIVIASRFKYFEGDSEWRILITYGVQLFFAILIIYVLCLALPDRVPLFRLILYVDGVFIVISAAVSIPLWSLTLIVPSENRELDIFDTEYERCLSRNSFPYWLLRGDLKFFLYNDAWKPADWANWFFDHYPYLLVIPFLFIFAFMLRPARKVSFTLICLFTAIAFVAVAEGERFVKVRLGSALAAQDTKCTLGQLDRVTKNYAPDLIARQVAYKINNDSRKTNSYFAPLFVDGTNLVLAVKSKTDVELTAMQMAQFSLGVHHSYCSDTNTYWVAARRINYGLLFVVFNKDDALLQRHQFNPNNCPKWPAVSTPR
jgi:hypothetical protein